MFQAQLDIDLKQKELFEPVLQNINTFITYSNYYKVMWCTKEDLLNCMMYNNLYANV